MPGNQHSFIDNTVYNYIYPKEPSVCKKCPSNVDYDVPPRDQEWNTTILGPTNLKHIYTGIPNYYPIQKLTRPYNSLYGKDLSKYNEIGERQTYGAQVYLPPMNYSPIEVRQYSKDVIPILDLFQLTKYKVKHEGYYGN